MMYATGVYRTNKPLLLDCTMIIMHRANDLSAIIGFCQQDMGLEVSPIIPISERKDPDPAWLIASMPQTQEAFKQVVDTVLRDKGTTSAAAANESNNETDNSVPDNSVPTIALSTTPSTNSVPVVATIASTTTPSTTHNVETNPTPPEESIETPTK